MELAMNGFYQTSAGNWYSKFFRGRHRLWFSLELISLEGTIHYVIRTPERYRDLVETNLYSQFPDIEIREVSDYTLNVDYLEHPDNWSVFGVELKLKKPDCYPIKTYVDFELGKDPKEEFKTDPMLGILETLGSIGPGEQYWIQIMIMPFLEESEDKLKEELKEAIASLVRRKATVSFGEGEIMVNEMPSPGERLVAETLENKLAKPIYDVGIRSMYIARKESAVGPRKYGAFQPFRVFNSPQMNSFSIRVDTDFDHPFSFQGGWYPKKYRVPKMYRQMFDAYRKRSYFYTPYKRVPMQLNVEELATIWHFPGRVSETPTLGRIESKRGEPPVNLPV
jgi:hypothetical protein